MKKVIIYGFLLLCLISTGCNSAGKYPRILISTERGNIEAELYPDKAPKSVAAFLSYVDAGYYNNSSFYRILRVDGIGAHGTGLIQGGTWSATGKPGPVVPGLPHESTKQTGLTHTDGTLSLARTTPGTAGTEFFICIGNQQQFDYGNSRGEDKEGFAAFGRVTDGMEIVKEIHDQPYSGDHFVKPVLVRSIKRL